MIFVERPDVELDKSEHMFLVSFRTDVPTEYVLGFRARALNEMM